MQNEPVIYCEFCGAPGWGVIDVNTDGDGSVNTVYGCIECGESRQYSTRVSNEECERLWSDWLDAGRPEGEKPEC